MMMKGTLLSTPAASSRLCCRNMPNELPQLKLWLAVTRRVGCSVGNSDAKTFENGATDENRKEEAVPVEVAALGHGEIEAVLRLSSNLEAEDEVQVFAEAPRRVTQLLVEEGTPVRKGRVLIQLQDDEQKSAVAKAEIELTAAELQLFMEGSLLVGKVPISPRKLCLNCLTTQGFNETIPHVEGDRYSRPESPPRGRLSP